MTARSPEPRTGYYAGSFDPFTIGHLSVAERGAALFDTLIIGIGINPAKAEADAQVLAQRTEAIRRACAHLPNVRVETYSCLTVEAAKAAGARWLLRAVRSVADYEYERDLSDLNRRISGLETVLLPALPELACISSSAVRELRRYGVDTSGMVP